MADPKRTLNIPIYDATVAPVGTDFGEDVIDAEVIESGFSGAERAERVRARAARDAEKVAGAYRNVRTNGVKDAFFTQPADAAREARGTTGPRVRARQEGRAQREEQARTRTAQATDAKRSEKERAGLNKDAKRNPLSQLKLQTAQAGESYMESLRLSGILDAGETKETQRKQLSGMHQVYASMMVLQCVEPLRNGLSGENIASVLGMGASMWMLSPNFRLQVGSFAGQMGDVIKDKIAARGTKKDDKAQTKFDALSKKGKGDQLSERWQKRLDGIAFAERGHRLPFTAQSAAMTEVALAEAAYADMRRPGADQATVDTRYKSAMSALYEYVEADGLDPEDVSRSMRVIVGQRLEKDPAMASVFAELGHGRFTKSEPREVYVNGTTDRATVWTGDFVDSYEGRTISQGSFSLRPPGGINEHRVLAADTLSAEMASAKSVGELNDVFSQYVVAASVGRYPDVIDDVEDPATRRRLGKAHTMFTSMAADGLNADEQRFAYSAAYVDAVERVQVLNPELGNKWAAQYGDNWREKVAEDIARYNDLGAEAERAHAADESKGSASAPGYHFTATTHSDKSKARRGAASQPHSRRFESDTVDPEKAQNDFEDYTEYTMDDGFDRPNSESSFDAEVIDGEVIEDGAVGPSAARNSIVSGTRSTSTMANYDQSVDLNSATARVRRARVNQHYNEVETGGITGFGSDDAAPLQDVDFELG